MLWLLIIVLALLTLGLLLHRGEPRGSKPFLESITSVSSSTPTIEIDIDHSQELCPEPDPLKAAHWLVLDTEGVHSIDCSTDEGISPPIALSWQLLSEGGDCILERSFVLDQSGLSPDDLATQIHGITTEQMSRGVQPELVYEALKKDLSQARRLVAHNLRYHLSSIVEDLQRKDLPWNWLYAIEPLCTMELGKQMKFKVGYLGTPLYPELSELYGYLRYGRLGIGVRFKSKTIRDVRLLSGCIRLLIGSCYMPRKAEESVEQSK